MIKAAKIKGCVEKRMKIIKKDKETIKIFLIYSLLNDRLLKTSVYLSII
jgi:hypothetical protein